LPFTALWLLFGSIIPIAMVPKAKSVPFLLPWILVNVRRSKGGFRAINPRFHCFTGFASNFRIAIENAAPISERDQNIFLRNYYFITFCAFSSSRDLRSPRLARIRGGH
jgi:hypothetical protein